MKSTKIRQFEKVFQRPADPKPPRDVSARTKKQTSLSSYRYNSFSNNSIDMGSTTVHPDTSISTGPLPSVHPVNKQKEAYRPSFYDPLSPHFSTDPRSTGRDTATTPTTVRTDRSSTPTTVRTKNPGSNNLNSYYLPLTTRRDQDSGSDCDISFGHDRRSMTPTPQITSSILKNATESSQDAGRSHSVISFAQQERASKEEGMKEIKRSKIRSNSPFMHKSDKTTKEELELMRRERELRRIIQTFQLSDPRFSKNLPIDQREELARKLLSKQVVDRLQQHEEKHFQRNQERRIMQKAFEIHKEKSVDPRANLVATMQIPTDYLALKGKLLDHIIDTEHLKKSRDEIFRRKFRNRKGAIKHNRTETDVIDAEPGVEFDERKVRLENLEKSTPLSDLRFKKHFDNWLDEELGARIVDKIEFLSKYHSINFAFRLKRRYNKEIISNSFSEGTRFDPVLPTEFDEEEMLQKMLKNESNPNPVQKAKAKTRSFSFFMMNPLRRRDPELNKWLIYLTKIKNTFYRPDGTMQHVTHHPNEYDQDYWVFIYRRRQLQEEAAEHHEQRDAKTLFQKMVTKVRIANDFRRYNKSEQTRYRLKKFRDVPPEPLKDIRDANREAISKYHSLYSQLHWDEEIEKRYRGARGMARHFLPVGSLGCANAVTTFEFFRYEQKINKEKRRIDDGELEEKRKFYVLNNNPYNRRRMQEEIDLIDKSVIEKLELDVANRIVSEYEQNKAHLYSKRAKYLEETLEKKKQAQLEKSLESQRKKRIAKAREEHIKFSNHIRRLLDKKKKSRLIDENFVNSEFYQKVQGYYSKVNNLRKVSEKIQTKRDLENGGGRKGKDDEREVIVADPIERTRRIKMRKKMTRLYSGGPRMLVNKTGEATKDERVKAAIQLQAFFRGAIARMRYKRELEMKKMRDMITKKIEKATRFKLV